MMRHNGKDAEEFEALDAALGHDDPIGDPEFQRRLLADYDGLMQSRRARPLTALADAFGWRALSRPFAPAVVGAAMVIVGGVVGVVTAPAAGDYDEVYVFLAAGLDPARDFSAEVASWAEQ